MARFNIREVVQAISIENTAVNEYLIGDDGDQFRMFPGNAITPVLPTRTPVEDNAVGDGRAYPKQGKPYYFNPINFPYSMALNSTMGQRIFRMWLGGTIADTVNGGPGTTDQVIQMKDPGATPMVCNLLRKLGGEYFIFGDAYVQTIEISQQGAGEPQISAAFNNPGHYFRVAPPFDIADVDEMDTNYLKYHGAKTTLTFSDGSTTFDYVADNQRLIDLSFSGNQNCIVDQLPGDGFVSIQQIETQTVVGSISSSGDAKSVVTAAGMTGSPKTVTVPVTTDDTTAALIAAKFRAALEADVDVAAFFSVGGTGANVVLTRLVAAADDPTMNFTIEDDTSVGITDSTTSENTTANPECYGAISKNFYIDVQSAEIRGKVYMDANFSEFATWAANKKLTSVTVIFRSCEIIGATTHQSEIEIKMPIGEFNLEGDQQGNFSAYSFTIRGIEGDPTTGSLIIGRVRRVTGALIDETAP